MKGLSFFLRLNLKDGFLICIVIFGTAWLIEMKVFELMNPCLILLMENMKLSVSNLAFVFEIDLFRFYISHF